MAGTDDCDDTTEVCMNTEGSFICVCAPGFVADMPGLCVGKYLVQYHEKLLCTCVCEMYVHVYTGNSNWQMGWAICVKFSKSCHDSKVFSMETPALSTTVDVNASPCNF